MRRGKNSVAEKYGLIHEDFIQDIHGESVQLKH